MNPIVVPVHLTSTDWEALRRFLHRQALKRPRWGWRSFVLSAYALIPLLILLLALAFIATSISIQAFLTGLLLFAGFVALSVRASRKQLEPPADAIVMAPVQFEFDATGFRTVREHSSGFVDWRAVRAIEETPDQIFLVLDRISGYCIPKRQIASMEPEALAAQLRQWRTERQGYAGGPAFAVPVSEPMHSPSSAIVAQAPERPSAGFGAALRSNLLAGLRALFFRPVPPGSFIATFEQLVSLLLLTLGVAIVLDRVTADADAAFSSYIVYIWIALLMVALWICALLARSIGPQAETRRVLVVGLALAPWTLVLVTISRLLLPADGVSFTYVLVAITLWAGLRAMSAAYGPLPLRTVAILVVAVLAVTLISSSPSIDTRLWATPAEEADDSNSAAWQETEDAFFEQRDRIDASVAQLAPERPGVADFYFMGFAGDGSQRIFRRESLLAQGVFAKRLGTGPRSLQLINDYGDLETFPLATLAGLRYALDEVGQAMDPDEDVLVLFLTSHGSEEGGLSVRNGFDTDIPPGELRSALDDAGIRWRIVIVSACYSGIFVEPLKSDTTLIVTAADSRSTSFGCDDDRELTYFGETFLRDALPRAPSLQMAFVDAAASIRWREAQEHLPASNPQWWVGASMAKKLEALGTLPWPAVATPSPK